MVISKLQPTLLTFLFASLFLFSAAPVNAQTDEEKTKAKIHFGTGKKAFDAGDFSTALAQYNKAYALLPLPGLLFNIGQCYRNLNRSQEAINAFKIYLEESPDARNRPAVEKLIQELKKKLAERSIPPGDKRDNGDKSDKGDKGDSGDSGDKDDTDDPVVVAIPPPSSPADPDRNKGKTPVYKKWWFWTIIGAAVAGGAATGIYFGTQSSGPGIPGSNLGVLDYSR